MMSLITKPATATPRRTARTPEVRQRSLRGEVKKPVLERVCSLAASSFFLEIGSTSKSRGCSRRGDVKHAERLAVVHKTVHGMPLTYRIGVKKDRDLSHVTCGLRSVLDLDRRGGRLFQRDDETIILVDCNRFSSDQIECLQTVYPHLQATVVQSDASVTGFLVIFQMTSSTFKRTAGLLALHVILFGCGLGALWVSCSKIG